MLELAVLVVGLSVPLTALCLLLYYLIDAFSDPNR